MAGKKKMRVISAMCCLVIIASVTINATPRVNEFKNLKVLPKNINSKDLNEIMIDEFSAGTGMTCGSCHAKIKGSEKLDYASDEKPEKNIARNMMRMTLKMNRKYFGIKHPLIGAQGLTITCTTCHKGEPIPGENQ
jgi:Photosynthetic reaction centre cytochrome C subunit.